MHFNSKCLWRTPMNGRNACWDFAIDHEALQRVQTTKAFAWSFSLKLSFIITTASSNWICLLMFHPHLYYKDVISTEYPWVHDTLSYLEEDIGSTPEPAVHFVWSVEGRSNEYMRYITFEFLYYIQGSNDLHCNCHFIYVVVQNYAKFN